MVAAQQRNFSRIYSIELDHVLYQAAKERFSSNPSVTIIEGDSGLVLPKLLDEIAGPCLFWLDGHYSAGVTAKGDRDTPISAELSAIVRHSCRDHIILIDDARCFNGEHDYPRIEDLIESLRAQRPGVEIIVDTDVIRVVPGRV
jgi:hypothetical protein